MRDGNEVTLKSGRWTVGVDLGDRFSQVCILDGAGEVIREERVTTGREVFARFFGELAPARVVLEAGTHSLWASRVITACSHEVLVANPRTMPSPRRLAHKSDRNDARELALMAHGNPRLLRAIRHRGEAAQRDLSLLRARDVVVRTRTLLVNSVRGLLKADGARPPKCSTASFPRQVAPLVPDGLKAALLPLLELIAEATARIKRCDRAVAQLVKERHPAAASLSAIAGVGALTALCYVLTLEDPHRFQKSRDVGSYLGLVPRRLQSGERDPQLHISKMGDGLLRRLLVGAGHYILGPFGPECDLRRFGSALAARGGKSAKKRAVVAVARKLAVVLHRLWVTGEVYDPDRTRRRVPTARPCAA